MISIYRARVIVSDGPPMLPGRWLNLWNKDELAFLNIMDELFLFPHTAPAKRTRIFIVFLLCYFYGANTVK